MKNLLGAIGDMIGGVLNLYSNIFFEFKYFLRTYLGINL